MSANETTLSSKSQFVKVNHYTSVHDTFTYHYKMSTRYFFLPVINPCDSYPCHRALCTPLQNDYMCKCLPGTSGKNCENGKNKKYTDILLWF